MINYAGWFSQEGKALKPAYPIPKGQGNKYRAVEGTSMHIQEKTNGPGYIKLGVKRTGLWLPPDIQGVGVEQDPRVKIMLDSGAPSLYNKEVRQEKGAGHMGTRMENRGKDDYTFFSTDLFLKYRDEYIEFIKKYLPYLECYVNIDVINNPEMTWENQQYLEAAGLNPVPVFHFGCDEKWLQMYIDRGHDYIALGGLVPMKPEELIPGLDRLWREMLCDSTGMPKVKVHGFAVTSVPLVVRYPWYSVDSTSWVKFGKYGVILFPREKMGKADFTQSPQTVPISYRSTAKKDYGKHFHSYSPAEQRKLLRLLAQKGFVHGKSEFKWVDKTYKPVESENERWASIKEPEIKDGKRELETVLEWGVANDYKQRDEWNIHFYLGLESSLPKWPWAFTTQSNRKRFKVT